MKRLAWAAAGGLLALAASAGAQGPAVTPTQGPYVQPQVNPFPRPTVSPYLNLFRGGNPAINYHNLIRPQLEVQSSLRVLETQTDLLGLTITETQPITGITGASSQFMTHRRYFFNLGTRSAAMQPAVIPQANTGALRPVN